MLPRRLRIKPYRIQVQQALNEGDRERLLEFCEFIFGRMEVDDNFVWRLELSGAVTFKWEGEPP